MRNLCDAAQILCDVATLSFQTGVKCAVFIISNVQKILFILFNLLQFRVYCSLCSLWVKPLAFWAISRQIRALQRYNPPSPPPYIFLWADSIERGANGVGMSIPPLATTESRDRGRSLKSQPYKAQFLMVLWV